VDWATFVIVWLVQTLRLCVNGIRECLLDGFVIWLGQLLLFGLGSFCYLAWVAFAIWLG